MLCICWNYVEFIENMLVRSDKRDKWSDSDTLLSLARIYKNVIEVDFLEKTISIDVEKSFVPRIFDSTVLCSRNNNFAYFSAEAWAHLKKKNLNQAVIRISIGHIKTIQSISSYAWIVFPFPSQANNTPSHSFCLRSFRMYEYNYVLKFNDQTQTANTTSGEHDEMIIEIVAKISIRITWCQLFNLSIFLAGVTWIHFIQIDLDCS